MPHWRDLPIRAVVADGTVHVIYGIGDELAARFPLRGEDVDETRDRLVTEAAAARELAGCSPVPVPEPVALGEPGPGYPLPWAVQTRVPGRVATEDDPSGSVVFARDLADFIHGLRAADTRGRRFCGNNRGGDLKDQDGWMEQCWRRRDDARRPHPRQRAGQPPPPRRCPRRWRVDHQPRQSGPALSRVGRRTLDRLTACT